jgi:hypothetical protein
MRHSHLAPDYVEQAVIFNPLTIKKWKEKTKNNPFAIHQQAIDFNINYL